MRILVVGAERDGRQAPPLRRSSRAMRSSGPGANRATSTVDLTKPDSIAAMYKKVGKVDAVVACTGHAHFGPLTAMTADQFMVGHQ